MKVSSRVASPENLDKPNHGKLAILVTFTQDFFLFLHERSSSDPEELAVIILFDKILAIG